MIYSKVKGCGTSCKGYWSSQKEVKRELEQSGQVPRRRGLDLALRVTNNNNA